MAGTHFKGPVYSKGGFGGQVDNTTGALVTGPMFIRPTPVTVNTAGNVTYSTAQVLNGTILRDTNGAARTDTFPTAAALVAAVNNVGVATVYGNQASTSVEVTFTLYNISGAANAITPAVGTGGTAGTTNVTAAIAQGASRSFRIFFTNVTAGAEAYTVYA